MRTLLVSQSRLLRDPRAKKPSPQNMDDEEYAAAWEDYRLYCRELDIYREFEYIRKDFAFVVSCFSELYGEELFNYLRVHQDNHELRKRFVLTLDNGDHVFDCKPLRAVQLQAHPSEDQEEMG